MIAGWVTAEDNYEEYLTAVEKLGAKGFLSVDPQKLAEADGLILPGSGQDMNPKLWGEKDICSNDINDRLDEAQWELLELARQQGKPVLGICRGMQFINVFYGGTLIQDLPCAAAHKHEKGEPERFHPVLYLPGNPLYDLFGEVSEVNTRHHQGAGLIGAGLETAALWNDGEDSVAEAVWHDADRMLGVQWHPERMYLYGDENQQKDGEKLLRWWLSLI